MEKSGIEPDRQRLQGVAGALPVIPKVDRPGVEPETVKLTVDANMLTVAGFRCPRAMARGILVHRLELPYGKFERQLALPTAHFQLSQPEFSNGCLVLALSKRRLMEERTDV